MKPTRRRQLPYALFYLLPFASVVYLLLLPQHPLIAQRIYTDENAWAAEGAREALTAQHIAHAQHVQRAIMTAEDLPNSPTPASSSHTIASSATSSTTIRSTIADTWRGMGMDVHSYRHQHDARGRWAGEWSELSYAVVPSRMGDGKEAVALVVQYDPSDARASVAESTMSGVAIVSGLAQYLLGQSLTDREQLTLRLRLRGP